MLRTLLFISCLLYVACSIKCHNSQIINGATKVTGTKDCDCDYCVTSRVKYASYEIKASECGCLGPGEKTMIKNALKDLPKLAAAFMSLKCTKPGTTDDSAKFGFPFFYMCCKGDMCNALEPFSLDTLIKQRP